MSLGDPHHIHLIEVVARRQVVAAARGAAMDR